MRKSSIACTWLGIATLIGCGSAGGSDPSPRDRTLDGGADSATANESPFTDPAQEGGANAVEVCGNGLDDDGNSLSDDGCHCQTGQVQACFPGSSANAGIGACAMGTQTCSASQQGEFEDNTWGPCVGAGTASTEVCDGNDNDCDGTTDNGCACTEIEKACSTICGNGKQLCENGTWGECSARLPTAEICNGFDDDCNGTIDDGITCADAGTATCPSQSVSWQQCSGTLAAGTDGQTSTSANIAPDYVGSSSWTCDNGTWKKTSESCSKALCSYDWGKNVATSGPYVKIYVSLVGRSPEPPGLWHHNNLGYSAEVIGGMASCNEPSAEFGNWQSPDTVVEHIYQTAFNRQADPTGKAHWLSLFANGTFATTGTKLGQFVMLFLDSAQSTDATALQKREEVARYWVQQLVDHRCPWDAFGKTVLTNVTHLTELNGVKASIDAKIKQMEEQALSGTYPVPLSCH